MIVFRNAGGLSGVHTDVPTDLVWQPSLFGSTELGFDAGYSRLQRIQLDAHSWLDHAPGWVTGSNELFEQIVHSRGWAQRRRRLYDNEVEEPRLTASWKLESGKSLQPSLLEDIRCSLNDRYGISFDSLGFNLYRGGRDSVAWHRDHIDRAIKEPVVVLVSLGEPRRFLLRPYGGGPSLAFMLGHGDLLVTGGKTQRSWEHSVPKVAHAGPRISLAYRHGLQASAYVEKPQKVAAKRRYRPRKSTISRL
jgi:alkylated DNA repair dioxygenase AlkB